MIQIGDEINKRNILLVITSISVMFLLFNELQTPLAYSTNPLFDGNHYQTQIDHFRFDDKANIERPYNTRIIVPYIYSFFNAQHQLIGITVIHFVVLIILTGVLLLTWRQLSIKITPAFLILLMYAFHWSGGVRYYLHDPVNVDVLCLLIFGLYLWLKILNKQLFAFLLIPIGVAVKEAILVVLFAEFILGIHHAVTSKQVKPLFLPLCSLSLGIGTLFILQFFFPNSTTNPHSTLAVIGSHVKQACTNPSVFIQWFTAIFFTFGGFALLLVSKIFRTFNQSSPTDRWLTFVSMAFIIAGITTGRDMTRIILLGFPFHATLVLRLFQHASLRLIFIGTFLSLPVLIFWANIPNGSNWDIYRQWYVHYMDSNTLWIWFTYGIFTNIALVVMNRRTKPLESITTTSKS